MGKEKKTVSLPKALVDLMEKHIKKPVEIAIGEGKNKLAINVNPMPSAEAKASAIITAANICFDIVDGGVEGYMPGFIEFAHRYGVLLCFTDFEVPQDLTSAWGLILYTPIYEKVVEVVGAETSARFVAELDKMIDARKQERIQAVNIDRILAKFIQMFDGFGKRFEGIDVKETLKMFENLPEMAGKEGALNNLDIGKLIKTFLGSKGEMKLKE